MWVSTKGRYALRVMLDIAQQTDGKPVRVKDISARQEVSVKYLEQIISPLVKAGYLRSLRGPQGGYVLARKPSEYTLGSILAVTEGSLTPVECLEPGNDCERAAGCITIRFWKELDSSIKSVTEKYTLQSLLDWSAENYTNYVI